MVGNSVRAISFSKVPNRTLGDIQVTMDLMFGEQTLTKNCHCHHQPGPWSLILPLQSTPQNKGFLASALRNFNFEYPAIMVASYKKFPHRKIIQFQI
jgi:hypothetical protein